MDLTHGHAIAYSLWEHTSNTPLFRFAKRHRGSDPQIQVELNAALVCHAGERNEKAVSFCPRPVHYMKRMVFEAVRLHG